MHEETVAAVLAALDYHVPKMVGEIWCVLALEGSVTLASVEEALETLLYRGEANCQEHQADHAVVDKWLRIRKQQQLPPQPRPTDAPPIRPGV